MQCRIADLRCKEVVNVCDGFRLGYVDDVLLETGSGRILALVVPGPCRLLGLFLPGDDYIINWECVQRIGEDLILVELKGERPRAKKRGRFR
jgi:YlmC/YmxH family sporulation protein